uniref:Uncharacterized protein n=1 Tax=Arundo donax TaxID=35708 RepID=A0A0A9FCT5_ARUDO
MERTVFVILTVMLLGCMSYMSFTNSGYIDVKARACTTDKFFFFYACFGSKEKVNSIQS